MHGCRCVFCMHACIHVCVCVCEERDDGRRREGNWKWVKSECG